MYLWALVFQFTLICILYERCHTTLITHIGSNSFFNYLFIKLIKTNKSYQSIRDYKGEVQLEEVCLQSALEVGQSLCSSDLDGKVIPPPWSQKRQ